LLAFDGETIRSEANYAVIRTRRDQLSEVFNTGRYVDRVANTQLGLKFAVKLCVYDSELIPNSIIYPI
jgi:salicylate 5-hydroxylase small subunit